MGGAVGTLHCCPKWAIREQAAKMIAELPSCFKQEATVTENDLLVAEAAWNLIIHDKDVLSRFFDAFFKLIAESGDTSIADAHGKGLKTKSKFIVDVFADSLRIFSCRQPSGNSKSSGNKLPSLSNGKWYKSD